MLSCKLPKNIKHNIFVGQSKIINLKISEKNIDWIIKYLLEIDPG